MEFVLTFLGFAIILLFILRMDARYVIIGAIWYVLLSVKVDTFSVVTASILSLFVLLAPKLVRLVKKSASTL